MLPTIEPHSFADAEALLNRLEANPRECVFLFGAPLTGSEVTGGPGVPSVSEIVDLIVDMLGRTSKIATEVRTVAAANPTDAYQKAFASLYANKGPDVANAAIRKAVIRARTPNADPRAVLEAATHPIKYKAACEQLQNNDSGWFLRESIRALGWLLVHKAERFGRTVLTTNFDPLIEVAISREGGQLHSSALHSDGSLGTARGRGCHLVYLHGHWFGSDTLHVPHQLTQDRPQLKSSLKRILDQRTLVVLAYSGWDDLLTRTIAELVADLDAQPDIVWTFYERDIKKICASQGRLLSLLGPGIGRSRVTLYHGVDVHELLPELARRFKLKPAVAHIAPFPDPEMIADRLGSAWGMDEDRPVFGQVFRTKAAAQRAFELFLTWNFGKLEDKSGNIVLSITKEDMERYTFLLYPGERGVGESWKNTISEELGGEARPSVTLVIPWFFTHADYWGRAGMKKIMKGIPDGTPVSLNAFYVDNGVIVAVHKRPIKLSKVRVYLRSEVAESQIESRVEWRDPWWGRSTEERQQYEPLFEKYRHPQQLVGDAKRGRKALASKKRR